MEAERPTSASKPTAAPPLSANANCGPVPASLTGALDQLLGYLTWRDSKASVLVFNTRNKNFSKILPAVPDAIRGHSLFFRDLPCEETGEWRVLMRSEEDEGRRVTVHVFLFDLYQAPDAGMGRE